MAQRALSIPLFDAGKHLYETPDARTEYLPERYKGAIDSELTGPDEEPVRKIMGGNLARLMNVADVAVR